MVTTGRAWIKAAAVMACKRGPGVGWIIFQKRKSRMLKQSSHATLKTHKTGFHLGMTETVRLRRLQEGNNASLC